jgi:hypothetical protein
LIDGNGREDASECLSRAALRPPAVIGYLPGFAPGGFGVAEQNGGVGRVQNAIQKTSQSGDDWLDPGAVHNLVQSGQRLQDPFARGGRHEVKVIKFLMVANGRPALHQNFEGARKAAALDMLVFHGGCRSAIAGMMLEDVLAMDHRQDKRDGRRLPCSVRVKWSYFNKAESHAAKMMNYSPEGVGLELDQPLIDGASVVVRLEDDADKCRPECADSAECPWLRSMVIGHVKWCEPGRKSGALGVGWMAGVRMYAR